MDWGNAIVRSKTVDATGKVTAIIMDLHLDGDFRIAPTGPSFHARRPVAVLDRIIVDKELRIEAAGVHHSAHARLASDHLPIWARVGF